MSPKADTKEGSQMRKEKFDKQPKLARSISNA